MIFILKIWFNHDKYHCYYEKCNFKNDRDNFYSEKCLDWEMWGSKWSE